MSILEWGPPPKGNPRLTEVRLDNQNTSIISGLHLPPGEGQTDSACHAGDSLKVPSV